MKKLLAALLMVFGTALFAEMRPGAIVTNGEVLPVVADLNRDGLTDLVHDREVLVNQGNATFVVRPLGLAAGDNATAALDLNGDGYMDLVTASGDVESPSGAPISEGSHSVYLNDGQMNFGTSFPIPMGNLHFKPYTANINDDGKDDLVLVGARFDGKVRLGSDVRILLSRGDGTFDVRQTIRVPRDPQFSRQDHVVTGDLDEDGRRDLLLRTPHYLVVMRGIGNGDFAPPELRYLPRLPFHYTGLALVDIDRDGHLDVALAGPRSVRVLFGDGRARFPRHSFVKIPQLRQVEVALQSPRGGSDIWLAEPPRGMVFGEFVSRGRTEIAAAVWEGDVVFIAYEHGKLREVARTETEFQAADIHTGAFREPGKLDFYMTWNAGVSKRVPPRVFEVEPTQVTAASVPVFSGRSRSVRAPASPSLNLDVLAQGAPCIPSGTQVWTLAREGPFGVDRGENHLVETAIEDGVVYFRLTAPWTAVPIEGELHPKGGNRYEGTVQAETTCGYFQFVDISAVVR